LEFFRSYHCGMIFTHADFNSESVTDPHDAPSVTVAVWEVDPRAFFVL